MKRILIALILLTGVQGQANAQFLKKLGNAIENVAKKIDHAASSILNGQSKTSKSYQLDNTKVSITGDNPGVNMTKLHATRVYGSKDVILDLQLCNNSDESWKLYSDIDYCVAVDDHGNQYKKGGVDMGSGRFEDERTSNTILDDTKMNMRLLFNHVNLDETRFKRVDMGYYYSDPESKTHNGAFRMDNVPITLLPSLKGDGVYGEGKVLIGSVIEDLPQSIPYMYDSYKTSQLNKNGKTYTVVTFTLDGNVMFKGISSDNTSIKYICVETPHVQFKVGEHFYQVDQYLYQDDQVCSPNASGDLTFKGLLFKREENPITHQKEIKRVYAGLAAL